MPVKSVAQRKKFFVLAKQGKISDNELHEWVDPTKGEELPERLSPKPPKMKRTKKNG